MAIFFLSNFITGNIDSDNSDHVVWTFVTTTTLIVTVVPINIVHKILPLINNIDFIKYDLYYKPWCLKIFKCCRCLG